MFTAQEARESVAIYENKKKEAIEKEALRVLEEAIIPNVIANAKNGLYMVRFTNKALLFKSPAIEEVVTQKLKENGYGVNNSNGRQFDVTWIE